MTALASFIHKILFSLWLGIFILYGVEALDIISKDTTGTSINDSDMAVSITHCPDPQMISPCNCTFYIDKEMDINCSMVRSEDEMREVFNNNFPYTNFRTLYIENNRNIQSIRQGDFGNSSFRIIHIESTSLAEVEDTALMGSFDTLEKLNIWTSELSSVPDISNFTKLVTVDVWHNNFNEFPILESKTLIWLRLHTNYITEVPVDALQKLPVLGSLTMAFGLVTEILPETFTRNKQMWRLDLSYNNITTLPNDAIKLQADTNRSLYLQGNQLSSITYEAISSANDLIYLDQNKLSEFPEDVFRPLLEDGVQVHISHNPFKCECDIAWLVFNQTLMHKLPRLDDERWKPTCSDGSAFIDLDPEVYHQMCPNITTEWNIC